LPAATISDAIAQILATYSQVECANRACDNNRLATAKPSGRDSAPVF
jgi:hypothetical protein